MTENEAIERARELVYKMDEYPAYAARNLPYANELVRLSLEHKGLVSEYIARCELPPTWSYFIGAEIQRAEILAKYHCPMELL